MSRYEGHEPPPPMISIGNIVSAAAGTRYFDEAVAGIEADYVAGRGEAPGRWRGPGAAALGLQGHVRREDLVAVLEGRHPESGEDLGRRWASQKNVAYDVTYSLPKSVSLLYALGDPEVKRTALRALDAGAAAAHDYLQRHAAWARLRDEQTRSVERVPATFVTASFVHRTARPVTDDGVTRVDPQLHTHLLIAAKALRPDGTWGALYTEPIYAHAAAAGAVGQAATRDALVRELGVRVHTNTNGTFEVDGFAPEQLAEFSRRHQQVLAAAAAAGATSLQGQKVAVLGTRESKLEIDPGPDLFEHWHDRAAAVGLSRHTVAGLLDREQVRDLRWFDADTVQEIVGRGERGLTSQASVFTRRDMVRSLASHAPLGIGPEPIEELADAILASDSVVAMVPPCEPGEAPTESMRRWLERGMEVHYSTPEVVALERRMLASAEARQAEGTAVLDRTIVEVAAAQVGIPLTAGQRAMVETVCTSPAGVVVVEGAAGVGKTTAARVIKEAFGSQGVPVVGCSLSGRATVGLQEGAAIPSFTAASLLFQLRTMARRFTAGGVVVADECSIMGPDLAELVLLAHRDRAKLVLVGDSQQLQPIDGGALFRSLGDRLGRLEVTEVVRQRELWDREVLVALRAGQAAPLVRRYLDEGRVHSSDREASRVGTMAADWVAATHEGLDVIAVARERSSVAALNAVTREAAIAAGLVAREGVRRECVDSVGHKPVPLGALEFACGDRVLMVGRNDRRRGLVKGVRGGVVEVLGDGTLVVAPAHGGPRVSVPRDYAGIAHGYAMTAHRAQGATADIALVHGSDAADRQWQYVALSRHRIRAAYYEVAPPERDIDGVHHGPPPATPALESRLVAAMSRDGWKASTLDYPHAYARQVLSAFGTTGADGGVSAAPTEAQLDLLRDHGALDDLPPAATWVHASLVIDRIHGTPLGAQAMTWLRESGATETEARSAVHVAERDLVPCGTAAIPPFAATSTPPTPVPATPSHALGADVVIHPEARRGPFAASAPTAARGQRSGRSLT